MSFGDQTVTFVAVTNGTPDRNGIPDPIETPVVVSGCRFRPLRVDEKVGLFDIATEVWKCTAPPDAAVLAADAVSELVYDGTESPTKTDETTFQVIAGAQPFNDFSSDVFKVTVLAKKQTA